MTSSAPASSATSTPRRALVTGATGYIGSRLCPLLLADGVRLTVLTRSAAKLREQAWARAAEQNQLLSVVEGDASDAEAVRRACTEVDTLYYLLHSMGKADNFQEQDAALAHTFADAAKAAAVRRIVYLSGLHPDTRELSPHLASRVQVGEIFLGSSVPTAVLQASIIIGAGSASFEMLRHLTRRLPVMVAPRWLNNRVQPIAITDVLTALRSAARLPADVSGVFDIAGSEVLSYRQLIDRFAQADGRRRPLMITVPLLTPWLASQWIGLITPLPPDLAKPLVGSLIHDTVVHDDGRGVDTLLPEGTVGIDRALALALDEGASAADVDPAKRNAADPDWAG
ncbi:SDR family NAD(P)-dependent oxidoreductase [Nakamurella aerolata]|uniref:SDR family NAD(P)-dependent oxidoreductase n=1 Tax=Nakamurella aerolata TaxID=1656892 RepID=UPI0031B647B5